MKKKIILLCSLLLLGGWISIPAKAQQNIPVVRTSNSVSFGEELAGLKKEQRNNASRSFNFSLYQSRRLVVKVNNPISDCSVFFASYGAKKVIDGPDGLYGLQFETIFATEQAANRLRKLSNVRYAEPDYKGHADAIPYYPMSDGVVRIGAVSFAQNLRMITSNTALIVAVVDSGVTNVEMFRGRIKEGYDCIENKTGAKDGDGHGTHVAGIIWDATHGLNVDILPMKVLDDDGVGDTFALVFGINHAVSSGAKVINISINLERDSISGRYIHSEYLHDAIKDAKRKGVSVVCSAGNDGINASNACPADLQEAVVVGAIDNSDKRASFSNYGESLDFVAPGVDIRSFGTVAGETEYMTGTSMAAPHVSGAIAMIRLMYPSYSPAQIESVLQKNTDDLGSMGKDKWYGYGVPNLSKIKTQAVQKVSLSASEKTVAATQTTSLNATVLPTNATLKTVTWISSNKKVAVVKNGVVVGVSAGTANITARAANGKTAVCKVTVTKAPQMPRTNFSLNYYSNAKNQAVVKGTSFKNSDGIQVELQDLSGKVIATATGKTSCTFGKLTTQKLYYYRARAYYDINGTRVYSSWSYRRVFSTAMPVVKILENKKGVSIRSSKIAGIAKYNVYLSLTNQEGSFVKAKTIVPGQSYTCSSLKGKPLTSYGKSQEFYVLFKPIYQKKEMGDTKYIRTKFTLR